MVKIDKLPDRLTRNKKEINSVIINMMPTERWYQIIFIEEYKKYELLEIMELPEDNNHINDCYIDIDEAIKKVRMFNSDLKRGVEFIDG